MKPQMQKMFRLVQALCLGLTLGLAASCQSVSPEARRAAAERTCLGYGFEPGSPALQRCMQNQT